MPKNEDAPTTKLDPERLKWIAYLAEMDGKEPNVFLQGWVVDATLENMDILLKLAPNVVPLRPAEGSIGESKRQELAEKNKDGGDIKGYLVPGVDNPPGPHTLSFIPRAYITKCSVSDLASMCGRPSDDENHWFTNAYIARTGHAPPPRVQG